MTKEKFKEIMESGEKVYLYFFSPFCGSCELTQPLQKTQNTNYLKSIV